METEDTSTIHVEHNRLRGQAIKLGARTVTPDQVNSANARRLEDGGYGDEDRIAMLARRQRRDGVFGNTRNCLAHTHAETHSIRVPKVLIMLVHWSQIRTCLHLRSKAFFKQFSRHLSFGVCSDPATGFPGHPAWGQWSQREDKFCNTEKSLQITTWTPLAWTCTGTVLLPNHVRE